MSELRTALLGSTATIRPARHQPAMCGPIGVGDLVTCMADGSYMRERMKRLEPWARVELAGIVIHQSSAPGRREVRAS